MKKKRKGIAHTLKNTIARIKRAASREAPRDSFIDTKLSTEEAIEKMREETVDLYMKEVVKKNRGMRKGAEEFGTVDRRYSKYEKGRILTRYKKAALEMESLEKKTLPGIHYGYNEEVQDKVEEMLKKNPEADKRDLTKVAKAQVVEEYVNNLSDEEVAKLNYKLRETEKTTNVEGARMSADDLELIRARLIHHSNVPQQIKDMLRTADLVTVQEYVDFINHAKSDVEGFENMNYAELAEAFWSKDEIAKMNKMSGDNQLLYFTKHQVAYPASFGRGVEVLNNAIKRGIITDEEKKKFM